jgi:drug/metabolite transporter (DMT)-like permease
MSDNSRLMRSSRDSRHSREDRMSEEQVRAERASRNSREGSGAKGADFLGPRLDVHTENNEVPEKNNDTNLMIAFVLMVFVGLGNKVFNKLMTIPMYNYPNFLNLLTSFVYIPVCFAYIIPMSAYGYIPEEQFEVPKRKFAIMGALDGIAGLMQIFAATYLPGPLIILMLQGAIPVSMVISKYLVKAQYNMYQYAGALIVAAGILVVLAPSLTGGGDVLWSFMLILSCVPMTLSSVYKELSLGEMELDPVFLML